MFEDFFSIMQGLNNLSQLPAQTEDPVTQTPQLPVNWMRCVFHDDFFLKIPQNKSITALVRNLKGFWDT